jgi:hypothetical protein
VHVQQPPTNLLVTENIEVEEASAVETSSVLSITPPSFSPLSLSPCPSDVEENAEDSATTPPTVEEPNDSSGSGWSPWCGFKAVLDNVDEEISPSFQRLDKPKQSMHQVHAYAVKDRVDMSGMSDKPPPPRDHSAKDLLPSTEDMKSLKEELVILLSR